jgi:hypothetical protein
MAVSKRSIFRGKALEHYAASRQKDVLPRLVSPPVFVFFWILLALLIVGGIVAWLTRVPTYIVGSGVVLDQGIVQGNQASGGAVAVVFLPANRTMHVRVGQVVLLQIGSSGTQLSYKVNQVIPGVISPSDARRRYQLDSTTGQIITGPSFVLTVNLGAAFPAQQYAGSMVSAQVQAGSQRVLSLLPGLGQLIGG